MKATVRIAGGVRAVISPRTGPSNRTVRHYAANAQKWANERRAEEREMAERHAAKVALRHAAGGSSW